MADTRLRALPFLLGLTLAACGGDAPTTAGSPSLVIVTIDTLRADHLGCYGYFRDTSPHLDDLAQESLVFERILAPMATTLPSHVSLFTATAPLEHGILANFHHTGTYFKPSEHLVTLSEHLSGAGYQTAAFVSALPLKDRFGLAAGFQTYNHSDGPLRPGDATMDLALEWLEGRGPEPFFLWVHLFDPHSPYEAPEPFASQFTAEDDLGEWLAARQFPAEAVRVSGELLDSVGGTNAYDAEIAFTDYQLGRLLGALDVSGRKDRTVLMVVGDHGEGLNQHGVPGHGHTWQEQLHVPLLVRAPGVAARRVPTLGAMADVVPTLLGMVDLPGKEEWLAQASGTDLLATDFEERPVLGQTPQRQDMQVAEPAFSLTHGSWKLTVREGAEELYDLDADPFELHDVRDVHGDRAARMRATLDAMVEAQSERGRHLRRFTTGQRPLPMGIRKQKRAEQEDLTAEELEQMRALGYVGGDDDG